MVFAPTGRDSIAQGNALGMCAYDLHPEGVGHPRPMSQAFTLENLALRTQGVALGYAVPPRRGEDHNTRCPLPTAHY